VTALNKPLADNAHHLERLCELFDLGTPDWKPSRVSGGFHHRMWRLDARGASYAIKQFADDVDIGDAATCTRLNATELTATEFASRGIPALASLSCRGRHLQVMEGVGYLVFPWTDWKARRKNDIGQYHAQTVARILARMHRADIHVAGLDEESTWPLTVERITDLLTLARKRNVHDAEYMLERLADIVAVIERQHSAHAILSQKKIVSHGDLDHKNVLWSEAGDPLLIDWESARPINPTYELLTEALDWSGITAHFEHGPFEKFLLAYVEAGGEIAVERVPAAFDAILGAWVNWMLYNVGRAAGLEGLRRRGLGSEQIDLSVTALLRLEKNISRLRGIAQRCATTGRGGGG
jgi:thiamine kinase-like enzyme